jgi:BirA family biotin operon repressor/biotin-[acetyl-CoA-carboxylase] ligase
LFNTERYKAYLRTRWLSQRFELLDEVNSTNSYLKNKPIKPTDGFLVLAESQNQGRGQSNRIWISNPGQNLTFSFYFQPLSPRRLHTLTVIIAHSCVKVLNVITQKPIKIKWPNDLIFNGQKIGGILVESELKGEVVEKLIIGIGINVNQQVFASDIPHATSLKCLMNNQEDVSREVLLAEICNELESDLERWNSNLPLDRKNIHSSLIGYGENGIIEINGNLMPETTKFVGICEQGFPTFVDPLGEIAKYRHEQIRFYPESSMKVDLNPGQFRS